MMIRRISQKRPLLTKQGKRFSPNRNKMLSHRCRVKQSAEEEDGGLYKKEEQEARRMMNDGPAEVACEAYFARCEESVKKRSGSNQDLAKTACKVKKGRRRNDGKQRLARCAGLCLLIVNGLDVAMSGVEMGTIWRQEKCAS